VSAASAIASITTNVNLGLGAFNDKLVQPFFVEEVPGVCTVSDGCTESSFAFRHIVNLTNDTDRFTVSHCCCTDPVEGVGGGGGEAPDKKGFMQYEEVGVEDEGVGLLRGRNCSMRR